MTKITIVGDALISGETIKKAVLANRLGEEANIQTFSWFEELPKDIFQSKILEMESYGPEHFDLDFEIAQKLYDTDYLIVHLAPISKRLLSYCKKIKMIGLCRGGTENIDLEACFENKIPVIRMVKNTVATAEFTIGLMLAVTRNITSGYLQLKQGVWQKYYPNDGYRQTLNELRIGIIGLGNIGTIVAERLIGFGVEVAVYHPNITEERKTEANLNVRYLELEELVSSCDIVSLHLRLNEKTENIINEKILSLMGKESYLINTARAGLVNEFALVSSLMKKEIGGAALDVVWREPLQDNHPLLKLANVLITPHIAGDTNVLEKAPDMLVKEMIRYLSGNKTQMLLKDRYMKNTWLQN